MTYDEIDFELKLIPIYIYYYSIMSVCNIYISLYREQPARVGKHPIYTFGEFINESICAEAGHEPLWRYYERRYLVSEQKKASDSNRGKSHISIC